MTKKKNFLIKDSPSRNPGQLLDKEIDKILGDVMITIVDIVAMVMFHMVMVVPQCITCRMASHFRLRQLKLSQLQWLSNNSIVTTFYK